MKLRDALDSIVPDATASHVYGQPYETAGGATIVPGRQGAREKQAR